MIWLKDGLDFPDYDTTDASGIIAVTLKLSTERLELAYSKGIFPWYTEGEPVIWYFPNPRFVLFPEELKVSKSMRKILDRNTFQFTENQNFEEVLESCQNISRRGQPGTWITKALKTSLCELHEKGLAKSVEVWLNHELVGGFYGIQGENIFCGESMFSKVSNASKAGFIYFVEKYANTYKLIDCQIYTPHLESLGARNIPANEFLKYL